MDQGNTHSFVDPRANKTEIFEIAIEKILRQGFIYNTSNRTGKVKRTGNGFGKRKDTKRAIVTLCDGTIDIFGELAEIKLLSRRKDHYGNP